MQNLISILIVIACATNVLAGWRYGVTYSNDNCTTPVAVELAQISVCPETSNWGCTQLYQSANHYYNRYCVETMPELSQFSALPVVITKYPKSADCAADNDTVVYFFAEDFVGFMVTDAVGAGHNEQKVNITCSESGDLYASICSYSQCALNSTIPADECLTSSYSATQTGCAAAIPPETPIDQTPLDAPFTTPSDTQPTNMPLASQNGPITHTPVKKTSSTSIATISVAISFIAIVAIF